MSKSEDTQCVVKHIEFGMYYFATIDEAQVAFNMTRAQVDDIVVAHVALPIRSGEPVTLNVDATRMNIVKL